MGAAAKRKVPRLIRGRIEPFETSSSELARDRDPSTSMQRGITRASSGLGAAATCLTHYRPHEPRIDAEDLAHAFVREDLGR